jgi:hypothetical protein
MRILPVVTAALTLAAGVLLGAAPEADTATAGLPARVLATTTDEWAFGDLNGDENADMAAVDRAGVLWLFAGKGYHYDESTGPRSRVLFENRVQAGTGWGKFTSIVRHGDFDGDGKQDLLARDIAGRLLLYAGTGTQPAIVKGRGTVAGTGWGGFTAIAGSGDLTADNNDDLLAQQPNGDLLLYTGTSDPAQPFSARGRRIGTGWKGDLLTAIGDRTADGRCDFMFRDASGQIFTYRGLPGAFPIGKRALFTDASHGRILKNMVGMGDLTSDYSIHVRWPDVLMQHKDGSLYFYSVDVVWSKPDDLFISRGWGGYRMF